MPVERSYEQQTAPQAGAPGAQASAAAFGGAIGDALTGAGGQVHEVKLRQFKAEQSRTADRDAANFALNLAEWSVTIGDKVTQMRETHAPGAAGHGAAVDELLKSGNTLLEGITDEAQRRRAQVQIAEYSARVRRAEHDFEAVKTGAKVADDAGQALGMLQNLAGRGADPGNYVEAVRQWTSYVGAIETIDADTRAQLERDGTASLKAARYQTLIDVDRGSARQALDQGLLDDLPPKVLSGLRQQLEIADQRAEMQARMAEAEKAAAARDAQRDALDGLEALEVRIKNGDIPRSSDIATAMQRAEAAGVKDAERLKFTYTAEFAEQKAGWQRMTTSALQDRYEVLKTRQDAGSLDAAGRREFDRLGDEIKQRGEKVAVDLAPLLKGGVEQRVQAIGELARMPQAERLWVAEAAGDRLAGVVSSIRNARTRALAVQGAAVRKARPDDYLPPDEKDGTKPRDVLDRKYRAVLGEGLVQDIGPAFDTMREVALDVMAGSGKGWNGRDFGRAIQIAFGFTTRADGTGQGGIGPINGIMTELPDHWNQREFEMRYNRWGFEGAVYGNGTAARAADIRGHYRLRYIGPGESGDSLYHLVDPQGRLLLRKQANGTLTDYVLPVPERPR